MPRPRRSDLNACHVVACRCRRGDRDVPARGATRRLTVCRLLLRRSLFDGCVLPHERRRHVNSAGTRMFLGDVRGEAIGRHSLPAEPAEGLAGRDVDALQSQQHEWLSVRRSSARGTQAPVVGVYFDRCRPADRSHCGVTRTVPVLLTASPIIAATCRGSDCWHPLRRL